MIVGFTGTQKGITDAQERILYDLLTKLYTGSTKSEAHQGDCIGADEDFDLVLSQRFRSVNIVIHPPIITTKRAYCHHKPHAQSVTVLPSKDYLDRNKDIVNASTVLVACPGEMKEQVRSGTWSTIRYAKSKGIKVYIIFPDGSVEVTP